MSEKMGKCEFVDELNKLRKSSSESIDNIEKFDDFKAYMHISRPVEVDLKVILKKINESGKKTLVLLCGSAGDGKSHLLSYLKNLDEERLLDGYCVYNDATESSAPFKTAIETLNDVLNGFSDANINLPGQNIIMAINLGVLSNFIESEYGKQYAMLREYAMKSNILTSQINENIYDATSSFQHVSFSDYHMYYLTENGVDPQFISDILSKIFTNNEKNPFYECYQSKCDQCPMALNCPVRHNYAFMSEEAARNFVAEILVKTTIKDKEILTTREILNYIYDIIVAHDFSYKRLADASVNTEDYLKEYIGGITPSLMFDYGDLSNLMNFLREYDPLLVRTEIADTMAIFYYVSSDISESIKEAIGGSAYSSVLCTKESLNKLNYNRALKAQMFNILVRISKIMNAENSDKVYESFLKDLYYYNSGKKGKLQSIYDMVEKGVVQWCGSEADSNIRLSESRGFELYENVKFEAFLENVPSSNGDNSLQRFTPIIMLCFEDVKTKEIISLDIDYSLYELISRLNDGYVQTAEDRNNHADFISFVSKVLKTGSASENIMIVSENGKRAILDKTKFGYKFKVVR
ncbi:MAG: DNA phosphorothioation-dependent restriction protein DptF [Hungatella sp.]|nr:DNA phosphorothioation-dependent restriction protein DptF [Hungatella sp.]